MRTPVRTYLLKNHENVWRIPQKALSLHVMRQKTFQTRYISYVLLALTCLLTACSGGGSSSEELDPPAPNPTPSPTPENQEIKLNASIWQIMEGMRATTFDNTADIQAEPEGFVCFAYKDGTAELYDNIDLTTVRYETDHWAFYDGITHRWPNYALNFFCIMPSGLANTYCHYDKGAYDPSTNPDGYSDRTPRITCEALPVNINSGTDNTKELIYAFVANQSKNGPEGRNGVTLTFKHPFARVYFRIADVSGTNVKINKVTISDIYNNGMCTINGTTSSWEPSGSLTNLVVTCSTPLTTSGTTTVGNFLVLPHIYDGTKTFTVNATWTDWSNVTKNVSANVAVDWRAGYSYTYTFTLSKYALKVDTSKYTEQW